MRVDQAGAAVLPCCAVPRCSALPVHHQLCPSGPAMSWSSVLDGQKNIQYLYCFSAVSPSFASWASSPGCQMNTSDSRETCRKACLGTQDVVGLWQRWLRLVGTNLMQFYNISVFCISVSPLLGWIWEAQLHFMPDWFFSCTKPYVYNGPNSDDTWFAKISSYPQDAERSLQGESL